MKPSAFDMCINREATRQPPNQLALQKLTKEVPGRYISQEKLTYFPSFEGRTGRGHSKDYGNIMTDLVGILVRR